MRLFGTAGIRGIYLRGIDVKFGRRLGMAVGRVLGGRVAVAWDGRRFSEALGRSVIAGLLGQGVEVVCLGLAPTPVASYWVRKLRLDGGVMVTASHNPPEYGGFKVLGPDGGEVGRDVEERIEDMVRRVDGYSGGGELYRIDPFPGYAGEFGVFDGGEARFLVDGGGGVAGMYTARILSKSSRVLGVNADVDPYFSSRPPEPRRDALEELGGLVRSIGGWAGFAHDGDGDRLAVINEHGGFVDMSRVIALFAVWALRRKVGKIVVSVDVGMALYDVAGRFGAEVKVTKLGRVERGVDEKTVLAAEPWKIVFPEWGRWADGIRAAYMLAKGLWEAGRPVSRVLELEGVPSYPGARISMYFGGDKECFYEFVRSNLEPRVGALTKVLEVVQIDGVKVVGEAGWVLIRVSGTEPKVRLYVEGVDKGSFRALYRIGLEVTKGGVKVCGGQ